MHPTQFHPAFILDQDGERFDRDALLRRARSAPALPTLAGQVVRVPCADPLGFLVDLTRVVEAGGAVLPDRSATTLAPLRPGGPPGGLVLRTSGSTGAPRLPAFAPEAVARAADRIGAVLGLVPQDRIALVQTLEHGFGLVGQLLAAARAGATVLPCARPFPAERAAAVQAARPTALAAVPYTLAQLLRDLQGAPEVRLGLRQIGSAGGPLPPALAQALAAAFPQAVLWNQYGCTEAGPRLTALPSTDPAFGDATGRPLPGVTLATLPDPEGGPGEIVFATDTAMLGYLGDPAATEAARATLPDGRPGWRTGDRGRLDRDAGGLRLTVLGRTDELVKLRGERVDLAALAQAAVAAGARAAVASLIDPSPTEPDGLLQLAYEADAPLALAQLLPHLPPGHAPRRLLHLTALPRLPSGKPDRAALAAWGRS